MFPHDSVMPVAAPPPPAPAPAAAPPPLRTTLRRTGSTRAVDAAAREGDTLAAQFYHRLATRLSWGSLVLCVLVGWVGRETLAPLASRDGLLVFLGAVVAFAALIGAIFLRTVVTPLISRPSAELAAAAEAVASGDLTIHVHDQGGRGQLVRLRSAIARMIESLRGLALALRTAAQDNAVLATRLTASSGEMALRAQRGADVAEALSRESQQMAHTIDRIVADAVRVTDIAADVAMGAQEGVARNRQLRELAATSRARLDAGAQALDRLGDEVRDSAGAVEALAVASGEIRAFVALVRKMAKQSKLLSLNAAMEAARAGHEGDGFAVVAAEVRRLATDSTDAAQRCEAAVEAIMERVAMSRALTTRTVDTVHAVLAATREGEAASRAVEHAVEQAEEWTGSVEQAAALSSGHAHDMTERLEELARATQTFVGAMRQVAAASEQQSASTQEIAAAAAALGATSQRLARLAGTFRLDERATAATRAAAAIPGGAA